jgi:hypothetical protein
MEREEGSMLRTGLGSLLSMGKSSFLNNLEFVTSSAKQLYGHRTHFYRPKVHDADCQIFANFINERFGSITENLIKKPSLK